MAYGSNGRRRLSPEAERRREEERAERWKKIVDTAERIRLDVDFATLVRSDVPRMVQRGPYHYRCPCPLHGGRGLNFAVYRSKKDGVWRYRCFSKCQERGDVFDYLRLKRGTGFLDAVEQLSGRQIPRQTWSPDPEWSSAPPEPEPLDWRIVERYERLLDLPIDPTGKDPTTPLDWWAAKGVDAETVRRFRLGFAPRCPTAFDIEHPERRFSAATIPVWRTDPETGERLLLNIRYRILRDDLLGGNKYWPHATGRGAQLYNEDSLLRTPSGQPRERGRGSVAFLLAGEIKTQVFERFGLGERAALLTTTAGEGAWIGYYGEAWRPKLKGFDRVVTILDPGMEDVAEQTARPLGRHGAILYLPEKADDYILAGSNPQDRADELWELALSARQARPRSVFYSG